MSHKLDAMVAERVMGWRVHSRFTAWWVDAEHETGLVPSGGVRGFVDEWSPSTDISCAWEAVEKILEWRDDVRFMALYGCACLPTVRFFVVATGTDIALCHGKTLPMAICVAALRAVGVSDAEIEEAMK